MKITNEIINESFSYVYSQKAVSTRMSEQLDLDEILEFCLSIQEKTCYDEELLYTEVEDGIFLYELLYGVKDGASRDGTVFLREMMNKKCKKKTEDAEHVIGCSCGTFPDAASNLHEYAAKRQEFLRTVIDPRKYGKFMRTCFPNSVFAEGCEKELEYVKDFSMYRNEITDCLSLLDEKAISLYHEYQTNLAEAQRILQAMLQKTCAPDPEHKKFLRFEFTYEQEIDGEMQPRKKVIECQPHFKLIRDDSDLRVYFWWQDDEVGDGKKVLIGRVGRHPWRKGH